MNSKFHFLRTENHSIEKVKCRKKLTVNKILDFKKQKKNKEILLE